MDTVTLYLQSISKLPLLSRSDEIKYGKVMAEGRKTIVKTIKTPKSLEKLSVAIENIDEEDKEIFQVLIVARNYEQIRLYMAQADFDVLIKYSHGNKNLERIITKIGRARDILIQSNLRLVVSLAKLYANSNSSMSFMDLIGEGSIGLIKAVDKFNPLRESKLGTLATWWIRQAIIRSLSNKSRIIRVPVHMVDAMTKVFKSLSKKLNRTPTPEEMQAELKSSFSLAEIKQIMDVFVGPVSMQASMGFGGDEGESPTYETQMKDLHPLADEVLADESFRILLLKHFGQLSPRENKILRLKMGL